MLKRISLLLIGLGMLSSVSMAQNTFRVSYQIAVPMGELADFIDVSAYRGMSFEYYNAIRDNVHLGLDVGWNFFHKEYDRQTYDLDNGAITIKQWRYKHVVPILIAVNYDFVDLDKIRFYGKFGTGVYYTNDELWAGLITVSEHKALYGMVPGIGFIAKTKGNVGFNFAAEYPFIVNGQLQLDGRAHAHYFNFKMGLSFGN